MATPVSSNSPRVPTWRACPPAALSPILQAALGAFYDNGYSGASVREIANRVGVTVPTLYYHYENKEMLLFSLVDSSMDQLLDLCRSADSEQAAGPEYRFLNIVECLVRYMAQSRRLAYLDAETRRLSRGPRRVYTSKRAEVQNMLLRVAQEGAESGTFAAPDLLAVTRALLGTIQAITTWYRPTGELGVDDLVVSYLEIALRMVGATPELVASVRSRSGRRRIRTS